jgi:RimJ/RimL family protein N-acetyltransferase
MIETARLRLREITEADAPALLGLYRQADVMRFMGPPPASLEAELANIAAHRAHYYVARGYGLWAVALRESDMLIGRCGLLDTVLHDRAEVELSYLLAPMQWGHGFATEAARAVLDFGAGSLGMQRVVALVHPENARSRRVAERIGMRHDGIVRYKSFGEVDVFVAADVNLQEAAIR